MRLKDSQQSSHSPPQIWPPSDRHKQLRVSIVSDAIIGRNGVGTYYLDLIEHLRDSVGSIDLIGPTQKRDPSFEKFSIPMPGDGTQRLVWPRVSELNRRLDQQRPNLIIIPSLGACSYFGIQYAKSNGIPVVVVNHTNFDHLLSLYWSNWISRPLGWMLHKLNRWLIGQAKLVAALNGDAYEDAVALGANGVRIMGTPVAADFINKSIVPSGKEIRRVIFVGRFAAEKGLDQVLAAAKVHSEIEFAIAGDGPARELVERASATHANVHYLGWLPRHRVLEELDDSDVLVLPSAIESFGTVALEALSRRRCVLLRPDCGIAKWPSLAKGLFYIQPGETVADALHRMIAMDSCTRDDIAKTSWDSVSDFNRNTIRLWLSFMADAIEPPSQSTAQNEEQVA